MLPRRSVADIPGLDAGFRLISPGVQSISDFVAMATALGPERSAGNEVDKVTGATKRLLTAVQQGIDKPSGTGQARWVIFLDALEAVGMSAPDKGTRAANKPVAIAAMIPGCDFISGAIRLLKF